MARTRVQLDRLLRDTLGSNHVYFDPPESFKLKYPCIVYSLSGNTDIHAENERYRRMKRYNLIYITQNADDPMTDILDDLQYCRLVRPYTASGLWHYAYEIFY